MLQGGAHKHNFIKKGDEGKKELWRILYNIMLRFILYGRFCYQRVFIWLTSTQGKTSDASKPLLETCYFLIQESFVYTQNRMLLTNSTLSTVSCFGEIC